MRSASIGSCFIKHGIISLLVGALYNIVDQIFIANDYIFFRVPFAFLDYEKADALVFIENILILSFWAFVGTEAAILCRNSQMKAEDSVPTTAA